jgi:ABC-type branched-subunit amino acid transport system ATPase component
MAMNQTTTALLSVEGLSRSFDGVKAVAGLSFDIERGGITAMIGPNGAGKTTVFNAITGFLRPDAGHVRFDGKEITRKTPDAIARMGIGRTFQDCKTLAQLPVLDNVMLAFEDVANETLPVALLRPSAMLASEREKEDRACVLLEQAGLMGKKNALAGELSYGQRKLLELCRVQALNPMLVLLDEPMSGLFPVMIVKMMEMIRRLRDAGKTVVFIEHNMKVVMELSDRVLVLNYGQLIADGTPDAVRNVPAVQDAYLGRTIRDAS